MTDTSKTPMRPQTYSLITTDPSADRAASMLRRGDAFGQWLSVVGACGGAGDGGA